MGSSFAASRHDQDTNESTASAASPEGFSSHDQVGCQRSLPSAPPKIIVINAGKVLFFVLLYEDSYRESMLKTLAFHIVRASRTSCRPIISKSLDSHMGLGFKVSSIVKGPKKGMFPSSVHNFFRPRRNLLNIFHPSSQAPGDMCFFHMVFAMFNVVFHNFLAATRGKK